MFDAKWYNTFRKIWGSIASSKAEEVLFSKINLPPNKTILELGCGTGINVKKLQSINFDKYVGLDFTKDMLTIARKQKIEKTSFIEKDLTEKPAEGKYDLIFSTWVLSHISEPSKVINNYYHNLNKKGRMFLLFLTKPKWYINFWFYPLIRMFASNYVSEKEIAKMKNIKKRTKYLGGMTTLIEIG